MSDIKFACPKCNQPLEAPDEMKGTTIACPNCHESLTIPNPEFRKCPFCAEEIRYDAVKCKHCGEMNKPKVQTIELTSKPLKAQGCLSAMVICVGFVIMIGASASSGDQPSVGAAALGIILLLVGLVWAVVTIIRIWWHHG